MVVSDSGLSGVIKSLFSNRVFLTVLAIKLLFAVVFISVDSANSNIFIAKAFAYNPFSNPYSSLSTQSFPYAPLMAIIIGLPFLFFSFLNNAFVSFLDSFLIRIPLLISDVVILATLLGLLPKHYNKVMLLYWASPIIVYSTYISGQLDIIPIALLMLSFYFLFTKKLFYSSIFMALSLATKFGVLLILPLFLLFLWKKNYSTRERWIYLLVTLTVFFAVLTPFIAGMLSSNYNSQSELRVFELAIPFSGQVYFFLVIALYGYVIFKAASFRTITKNILFMLTGVTFTIFVTLVRPSLGWYIWCIPFVVYFFVKQNNTSSKFLYLGFNAFYLLYFFLVPQSDVWAVFSLISPELSQIQTPYYILKSLGLNSVLILSLAFTFLSSTLIYISYLMYKYGVKSSLLFQQQEGIPVIGISGDSGSGKTTTSDYIFQIFKPSEATIIHGDDVHRWERGDVNWEKLTHLNPQSNKIHHHYRQISNLKKGRSILRSKYDHSTGKFTNPKIVVPKNYIIDEGLHTFLVDTRGLYDLKVYMDPSPELKLYWKINRDVKERGYSKEKVLSAINKRKVDSEKYISPQRDNADLIFSLIPESDIRIDIEEDRKVDYGLQIWIRSDIDIEPLISSFNKNSKVNLSLDYPNNKFQRMTFNDFPNRDELVRVLRALNIDHDEYGLSLKNVSGGIAGVIQLLSIYCLHRKLLDKYGGYSL
ncbi:MAG: hypothetical protein AABW73_03680 [Nanoarchaeota archaeon]